MSISERMQTRQIGVLTNPKLGGIVLAFGICILYTGYLFDCLHKNNNDSQTKKKKML